MRVKVTSMPGKPGPPVVDSFLPDGMGSMLEFQRMDSPVSFRLYINGDTLVFDGLKAIPQRYAI